MKIEEGLEFPVQQPEDEEFELTGQAGVIKLDKNELKLFGPNNTFTNANTGKVDSSVQAIAREDIWEWCKASMTGGPIEYLIKKCAVHGDVRWLYESLKATIQYKGFYFDERRRLRLRLLILCHMQS